MSPLDDVEQTKFLIRIAQDISEIKTMTQTQNEQITEIKTVIRENHEKGCSVAKSNKEQLAGLKKIVYSVTAGLNAIGAGIAYLLKQ